MWGWLGLWGETFMASYLVEVIGLKLYCRAIAGYGMSKVGQQGFKENLPKDIWNEGSELFGTLN